MMQVKSLLKFNSNSSRGRKVLEVTASVLSSNFSLCLEVRSGGGVFCAICGSIKFSTIIALGASQSRKQKSWKATDVLISLMARI